MLVNQTGRCSTVVVLGYGLDRIGEAIFSVCAALGDWGIMSRVPVTGASGDKIAPWKSDNSLLVGDHDCCSSGIGEYCPKCRIRGQSFVPLHPQVIQKPGLHG